MAADIWQAGIVAVTVQCVRGGAPQELERDCLLISPCVLIFSPFYVTNSSVYLQFPEEVSDGLLASGVDLAAVKVYNQV